MNVDSLPSINEKYFLVKREVIVLRIYNAFQLVRVRYSTEQMEFVVDSKSLTRYPEEGEFISLF